MNLTIYTDGSWDKRTKSGGWAFILSSSEGHELEQGGFSLKTTGNRMELMAIIQSLIAIEDTVLAKGYQVEHVRVHSDSQYSLNMINGAISELYESGGLDAESRVKNKTMLLSAREILLKLRDTYKLKLDFVKVTGHSNDYMNDRVDKLAVKHRIEGYKKNAISRSEYYARKNAISYY